MIVIDCEQGSDEWFMHRKGIPTASCFSKIIQPQLDCKTITNKNKKLHKFALFEFWPKGIYATMLEDTATHSRDIEIVGKGKTKTITKNQVIRMEPGACVIAEGGFKASASVQPYICLLIAESKFKAPAQWIDILRAVRHGTETEPEARRVYEWNHDTKVEQVGFCLTDDKRFGCSPDGLINDRKGGLEIKCPNLDTHLGYVMDGCLPNIYKLQVHGSMYVTGCDYWDFMSYAKGEEPFLIRTHRDDYTDKLGVALDSFYKELEAAREKFGVAV